MSTRPFTGLLAALGYVLFSLAAGASERIVGGLYVSDPNEAAYIANLDDCGGTIISDRWILTAGHCTDEKTVLLGTHDAQYGGISIAIEKEIPHPKFVDQGSRALYDFRLLKLAQKIPFSDQIRMIRLATPEFEKSGGMKPGRMATTYGWGAKVAIIPVRSAHSNRKDVFDPERTPTNFERYLRKVELPILSRTLVNEWLPASRKLDATMIPAGYRKGLKDSCYGDSGGPLVVKDPANGELVQIGIVSWGLGGCAQAKKPTIYANVAAAYAWIMQTLKSE